jgi:arsenate reductase-like glutaredoxin family protein
MKVPFDRVLNSWGQTPELCETRLVLGYGWAVATANLTLYWKSTCTSCRDARKTLRDANVVFDAVDYAKVSLDIATITMIVTRAASVAAVVEQPNLLRRPILLVAGKSPTIVIGFDSNAYREIVASRV